MLAVSIVSIAATISVAAIFIYNIRLNRYLIDYLVNISMNQHARQMSWFLDGRPLPGTVRENLVASCTTVRERLSTIHLAIQSILLQTVRPSRIELYLSDTISPDEIPVILRQWEEYGLTIHFVPDVGPHTKLVYTLRAYPNHYITTFDDDFYYPAHSIETLLRTAEKVPGAIVANWVRQLHFNWRNKVCKARSGKLVTPQRHERKIEQQACPISIGYDLFAYGTSGILYPPGCMDARVFDIECFKTLCPTEDDVWFKAMSLLNGTLVASTPLGLSPRHHCIQGSQSVALRHTNYSNNARATRRQLQAVFDYFDLYAHLKMLTSHQETSYISK